MDNIFGEKELEFHVKELLLLLLRRSWLIVIIAILAGAGAYSYSKYCVTPKYQSTTKVYICGNKENDNVSYSDIQIASALSKDCKDIIRSRTVLDTVIKELKLSYEYEELKKNVTVYATEGTRVLSITVEDTSPLRAKQIADSIREESAINIQQVMNIQAVNTIDQGNMPTEMSSPNTKMNTIYGALFGAILCGFIIVLVHISNDKIVSQDDIDRYLGTTILGMIPNDTGLNHERSKKKRHLESEMA